jgi:hypothetical protein
MPMPRQRTRRRRQQAANSGLRPNRPIAAALEETLRIADVVPPGRPHPLRDDRGIPLDVGLFRVTLGDARSWIDHTFSIVGTAVQPSQPRTRYVFRSELLAIYGALLLNVWSCRVSLPMPGVWVELRWPPDADPHRLFRCPEQLAPRVAAEQLRTGLRLLQDVPLGGRRKGTRKISLEEFPQRYFDLYAQQLEQFRSPPRKREVAEGLGIHPDTLRQYLREAQLPFPPD